MNLAGGPTTVSGSVTNNGSISATDVAATFTGAVTNNAGGTIKNTSSTLSFLAGLTNNGSYVSDPADNFFTDLTVGSTGYLVGGVGDRFIVSGSLANSSTQSALWMTNDAELAFLNGGLHSFTLAGRDLGAWYEGFKDNFAWGILRLGLNQTLQLRGTTGRGQYITNLVLEAGLAGLSGIQSNGLNLYYDPAGPLNAYLSGRTYQLDGGGVLTPVMTPEPSTFVLMAAGLALAVWKGRRRR